MAAPDGIQLGVKAPGTGPELQLLLLAGCFNPAARQGLLQPGLLLHSNALLLCLLLGCIIPLLLLPSLGIILQPMLGCLSPVYVVASPLDYSPEGANGLVADLYEHSNALLLCLLLGYTILLLLLATLGIILQPASQPWAVRVLCMYLHHLWTAHPRLLTGSRHLPHQPKQHPKQSVCSAEQAKSFVDQIQGSA